MARTPRPACTSPSSATSPPSPATSAALTRHDICAAATNSAVSPSRRAASSALSPGTGEIPDHGVAPLPASAASDIATSSGASHIRSPCGSGSHCSSVAVAARPPIMLPYGTRSGPALRLHRRTHSSKTTPRNTGTAGAGTPPSHSAGPQTASARAMRVHGGEPGRSPAATLTPASGSFGCACGCGRLSARAARGTCCEPGRWTRTEGTGALIGAAGFAAGSGASASGAAGVVAGVAAGDAGAAAGPEGSGAGSRRGVVVSDIVGRAFTRAAAGRRIL